MSKTLAVVAVSAVALIAVLVGASGNPHAPAPAHPSPSLLQWAAKGAISSSLGRDQTAFYATHRSGGLIADNATQRLTAQFDRRGVLVRAGTTTFGLQLLAYGSGGQITPVAPAAPRADANRVTYAHGAVTEWYANGPLGLEQGFDVRTPPATTAGDRLAIVLGVQGNARTRADGHGGLSLTGPDGKHLSYTGLTATDARGHVLASSLTASGSRAVIHVDTAGAVYPLRIDPFIQVAKFGEDSTNGSTALGGNGIAVAGTTAAVSVALSSPNFPPPPAVDVFVANQGNWANGATKVAQLTDADAGDAFGSSVALSADGATLAVGAQQAQIGPNAFGKVFVFQEPPGGWADMPSTSAAAVLNHNGPPLALGERLGESLSISRDASRIAAGAPGYNSSAGAVEVFDRPPGGAWTGGDVEPSATLTAGAPGDFLGWSVALAGDTIVSGAIHTSNSTGAAYVFQRLTSTSWPVRSTINGQQANDSFGWAAAISADANTVVVTSRDHSSGQGAAYVFTAPNGSWLPNPTPAAVLTASNPGNGDQLGQSVAIDGSTILAGAFGTTFNNHPGTGAAFVFAEPAGGWRNEHEAQELAAPDGAGGASFGQAVALSNGTAFAAAPFASAPGSTNQQGFIYAFGSFPTTGIGSAPAAPDGLNGWFRHPVNVTTSASDLASTVTAIRCALDPAAAPIGFGALPAACAFLAPAGATLAANGRHILFAAATNAAGYTAAPVSRSFMIDTVKPRLKCVRTQSFVVKGRGGLVAARVTDSTSGPAAPIVAKRANVSRAGKKSATLNGSDNAGNTASVKCRYTVVAPKIPTKINFGFSRFPPATFTIFTELTATKVPRGAKADVRCKGGGCPFAHRTVKAPTTRLVCKRGHKHCKRKPAPALTTLNLVGSLAGRHLAPKTVVSVAVTKPNTIGLIVTFTTHATTGLSNTQKCLVPGSSKPKPC